MRVDATIQARTGSTRLPGKVLKPIVGKPMLALQIERILQSRLIDSVIVATSDKHKDDAIEALACEMGVECFRGSENDVLGRVVAALRVFDVGVNVEFHGDGPLPDPQLVDSIIGFYLKNADHFDFVTNALKTTYPPGAEVWVYPASVLFEAERHVKDMALREGVANHIYMHAERFRICNLEAPPWQHYPDLYLEVDTAKDFQVVSAIYEHFYPTNPGFNLQQIIDFMNQNPELAEINRNEERRWKAFEVQGEESAEIFRFQRGRWVSIRHGET